MVANYAWNMLESILIRISTTHTQSLLVKVMKRFTKMYHMKNYTHYLEVMLFWRCSDASLSGYDRASSYYMLDLFTSSKLHDVIYFSSGEWIIYVFWLNEAFRREGDVYIIWLLFVIPKTQPSIHQLPSNHSTIQPSNHLTIQPSNLNPTKATWKSQSHYQVLLKLQ